MFKQLDFIRLFWCWMDVLSNFPMHAVYSFHVLPAYIDATFKISMFLRLGMYWLILKLIFDYGIVLSLVKKP